MEVVVVLLLTLFFIAVTLAAVRRSSGTSATRHGGYRRFRDNLGREIIGHGYQPYIPYLVTLGLFILTCNLIGWFRI